MDLHMHRDVVLTANVLRFLRWTQFYILFWTFMLDTRVGRSTFVFVLGLLVKSDLEENSHVILA